MNTKKHKALTNLRAKAIAHRKSITRYKDGLRAAMRGLWAGQTDENGFFVAMEATIRLRLTQAWRAGLKECGFTEVDLTIAEATVLSEIILEELEHVLEITEWIQERTRAEGGKLKPVIAKADLWLTRYIDVQNQAKSIACGDQKLKWIWDPRKDHCVDCVGYNGRIYRGSVWKKWDIRPQHRSLACHGYNCGCKLVPTDEPTNRGRPPGMTG